MQHVLAATLTAIALVSTAAAGDADFLAAHTQAVAMNAPGISFTIELTGRQTQFHAGELIPLDLVYEFRENGAYQINDGLWRGSGTGRLLEVFRVSPQAGTRPSTQDKPNFYRWAGGTPLDAKAKHSYRYRVYLNEWRRFDQPGTYRIYSTSARVWKPNVWPAGDNQLRETSNRLELEIIAATADWQERQFHMAVAALDRPAENTDRGRALRREALRRLRYLDTEAATRELVRRQTGCDDEESYEIGVGLHQSRFKATAVEELQKRLDAADFTVTEQFIINLAALAADARLPIHYNSIGDDQGSREKLTQLEEKHRALRRSLDSDYAEAAWAAAEHKTPLARARTELEQMRLASDGFLSNKRLSSERLARVRASVIQAFDALPASDQYLVLESYWKQLGGLEFLPVLRRFIAAEPKAEESDPMHLDLALKRVYELAPAEGRALILAEIRRAQPRASAAALTLLPAEPMPELDDLLAGRLEQIVNGGELGEHELAATLAARYASPDIYNRVRRVYGDNGGWACAVQAAMLAYLVRHGSTEGALLVNRALDARGTTGCYLTVLTDVANIFMSPALERIAVQRLNDKDPGVAANAISLLRDHGSGAAEQVLWRKFEQWHDKWKDRVGTFTVVVSGTQTDPQVLFEGAIVYALAHARNWITGPPKLKRLRGLCLTKPAKATIDRLLESWIEPVAIRFTAGNSSGFIPTTPYETWFVAQYYVTSVADLKKLLTRFPADTTFSFPASISDDATADEKLFSELERYLALNQLKLVRARRPK
jgi:hypothetical protein